MCSDPSSNETLTVRFSRVQITECIYMCSTSSQSHGPARINTVVAHLFKQYYPATCSFETDGADNTSGSRMAPAALFRSVPGSRDSGASARERWSEAGHVPSGSREVVVHTTMESFEGPKHRLVRFLSLSRRRRVTIHVGVQMRSLSMKAFKEMTLPTYLTANLKISMLLMTGNSAKLRLECTTSPLPDKA